MPHLLLLEDDADIRLGLEEHLRREGFSVSGFGTGKEAMRHLAHGSAGTTARPDVVLLDLTLPDVDGLDVLRMIRADAKLRALPVVLVTARNEEIDRVLGLELGADDYISKPYSSRELVARIRAILRRASFLAPGEKPQHLTFGPISVDLDQHIARVDGTALELTRREFELLAYFLQNPRRVLSREKILQQVWGLEYLGESRTIDAHVRRVRAKLGEAASLIETVVGVGYRMGSVDA
ncbi:response regulator transcription factor [Mesoterricola sediminis]|uniref:Phosphate regulon transcriptional regulatory protein PhoB n=1 Tax=Mesoterricola sediminis TaxID=2927980 RepID=A0AA48KDD0_9BACT|nr:response regulator transcription factor [Mesoterricola sediminis]BDU76955.1 DNA-binding response regulator [Mesoterricola sediminis]